MNALQPLFLQHWNEKYDVYPITATSILVISALVGLDLASADVSLCP